MAIEEGAFEDRGIDLQWEDIPEGTGRMAKMLRAGEADIAIILTEGIIKDIIAGNPSKIVQTYVASPLVWGIHVGAASAYQTVSELQHTKAAISRFGSGSHLMAYVNANQNNWKKDALQFEVIHNLDGAIDALTEGTADYFMWEKFTTKPLVDDGTFRRVGECPTPWPCFVMAASHTLLDNSPTLVQHVLEVINMYTSEFKMIPSIDRTLANRYGQQLADIQEWLSITRWSQENLSSQTLNTIQDTLHSFGIIDQKLDAAQILYQP